MNERFDSVQRVEFIKQICAGKKVLHLGCTNFPYTAESIENNMLLHFELGEIAGELYGFDFDQAGLDLIEKAGATNVFRADLEKLDEVALDETFDVIVGGEMIEHLSNPGLFLQGIKRFMRPDTELVLTTINAYCAMRFLIYGLRGKRGKLEPVHPDHVSYYSYRTLNLVLARHGLDVNEFHFYDIGTEHRPFNRWFYNFFNDVCVRVSPQLSDGIIAVAKLS
ncbi:MAG TPA: methyltransferase domain-containing protein [Pyrinomonadaceae bacterium]|nr:methyltransferase domain-containing protein [Pyrinomonadaceae bacterium]